MGSMNQIFLMGEVEHEYTSRQDGFHNSFTPPLNPFLHNNLQIGSDRFQFLEATGSTRQFNNTYYACLCC